MSDSPLKSLTDYSGLVGELLSRTAVRSSTVAVWSDSPYTGIAEGEVRFTNGLRMRKEVDFAANVIVSYGNEVYRGEERLYWYDDFPHPQDASLAATFPHHKHVAPDIRHHRVPAPNMSYTHPDLPAILTEIEASE